uniref:Pre-mRNA-processing factor 39 n=1 Tax=Caenorhabditis tropicalis TaxID=1561998 RepID=A0A1I7T7Y9_9PELO
MRLFSRSKSNSSRHKRQEGSQRSRGNRHGSDYKDTSLISRPSVATHFASPSIDVADFDNWVNILAKVDQSDDVEYAREKYRTFLSKYPNCYGFWQKYAEYEKKMGNAAEAKAVWEKGIISIPLSIDLWLGYTADVKNIKNFPSESLRDLYTRAIEIAGLEYQSDRLWLEAIGFERALYIDELCKGSTTANCKRIGMLFDKLLSTPTFHAPSHFERFVQYLNTIEPHLLLNDKEYQDIIKIVSKQLDKEPEELVHPVQLSYICQPTDNGMLNIVTEPSEGTFPITVNSIQHDPTALQLIRSEVIARRKKIYDRNMRECEIRAGFEANIKRPYFHVKPLDYPQLFNWLSYLDFEMKEGHEDRVKILFDRCLIPCALYEEFWIKYSRWIWKTYKSKTKTREIYMKAKTHCPSSLSLTLSHSAFEESNDNFDDAIRILDNFRHEQPGYVLLEIRYLGALRRKAEKESHGGSSEYVLNQYELLIRDSQASPNLHSFYSIKLARYHQKYRRDPKLAQKVLKKALTIDPFNLQLYSQNVDIAYSSESMTELDVLQAFDVALDSNLRLEDKVRFSQRKLDYLEELGNNIAAIEDHRDYHFNLLGQLPDNVTIRTRFVNDPSRVTLVQPMAPQQPMMYSPQIQQPAMNMVPMMQMQPMAYAPPAVQLTLIDSPVTSSTM